MAFRIFAAHGWEDEGTEEGEADLASVGVTGQHEIDEGAAGVLGDDVGEVWLMGHEDDGGVRVGGDGEVEVGAAGSGVVYAAEPEAGAFVVDGKALVDEDGDVDGFEGVDDEGGADGYVVVAEDSVAEGALDGAEDVGAGVDGVAGGDEGDGALGDEVTGEEYEVGGEGVDLVDDALEEVGFGEFVEVDVGELDDAISVEGGGEVGDGDGVGEDGKLVAGDFAGVEGECSGGGSGAEEESAAGEIFLFAGFGGGRHSGWGRAGHSP